ncbi:MAG: DUF1566 domain-containing protein [Myxococcales bacterium]
MAAGRAGDAVLLGRRCNQLVLGTYSDWRLPSKAELVSIVDSKYSPAINTAAFPNTRPSWFWTSTSYNEGWAWYVYLLDGGSYTYMKSQPADVRCVR